MSDNIEDKILEKLTPKLDEIVETHKQSDKKHDELLHNILDKQLETHSVVEDINNKSDINNPNNKLDNITEMLMDDGEKQSKTQEKLKEFFSMYNKDNHSKKAKFSRFITNVCAVLAISTPLISGAKFLIDKYSNTEDMPYSTSVPIIPTTEEFTSEELHSEQSLENNSTVATVEIHSTTEDPFTETEVSDEKVYLDDLVIKWEDDNFGNMVEKSLGKDTVTYSDIKNIQTLEISGQFMFIDSYDYEFVGSYDMTFYEYKGKKYNYVEYLNLNDLKYFTSLRELSIFYVLSIDCSIFNENSLENLSLIEIFNTKMESKQLEYISNLSNIDFMNLCNAGLSDIDCLSNMIKLKRLNLSDNNISDISSLKNLVNLEYLDLSDNNVADITALQSLTNLNKVIIWNDPITDWSPVSHVETVIKVNEDLGIYY